MNSVRQSCRPKHQVLILKCYPRFQKGVQSVKPNSSELSYLLYYASTRRSKLQKVGAFLEKRAARDVWRGKIGNVQVTLQILAALIEKVPRDLPLYARSVLTVLAIILRSRQISMVEETVPTFEMFCRHQDSAALTADEEYIKLYREIVQSYSSLASTDASSISKTPLSPPMVIRWRTVGLQAIKNIVTSEVLGADGPKQLATVLPVVLENLYTNGDTVLSPLQEKAQNVEKQEREQVRRRHLSIATVQTVDTVEGNPAGAGSTADADKAAESEARVLALRCLEKVFTSGSNRTQMRHATSLLLSYIINRRPPRQQNSEHGTDEHTNGNWATNLLEVIAHWTPVQDRFIILVTLMETLVERPVIEAHLEQQLTLASMMNWLLSSPINLIGLSVMDVLIGLLHRILLLLQLGDRSPKSTPQHSPSATREPPAQVNEPRPTAASNNVEKGFPESPELGAALMREELLGLLRSCIGSLATHIYYGDQVSDMIRAIISRIKPLQVEEGNAESDPRSDSSVPGPGSSPSDSTVDSFSSPAAHIAALAIIKEVLTVANVQRMTVIAELDPRSPVTLQAWEGTPWLLREPERGVRQAYVDALLSWLRLETTKNDLRVTVDYSKRKKANNRQDVPDSERVGRRAVSNASQMEKTAADNGSNFLRALHLTIFDIVSEATATESDILTVHLLLVEMLEKLGINAARFTLPVMMKLQSICLSSSSTVSPTMTLQIGSLAYGYLWALVEKFNLEGTKVANTIFNEISNRKKRGIWLDKINIPPLQLDNISPAVLDADQKSIPQPDRNAYTPFSALNELVSQIENAYLSNYISPPNSPASSPGRSFSIPLSQGHSSAPNAKTSTSPQLPLHVKEQMLSPWSKENCLAIIESEKAKSSSLSGSRTAATAISGTRKLFGINAYRNDAGSPTGTDPSVANRRSYYQAAGAAIDFSDGQRARGQSVPESLHTPITASSRDSTVRVNELRGVLSGINSGKLRHPSPLGVPPRTGNSTSSAESLVSDDFSLSDIGAMGAEGNSHDRSQFVGEEANDSNSRFGDVHRTNSNDIPPVPPLPSTLAIPGGFPMDSRPGSFVNSPSHSPIRSDRPSTAPSGRRARASTKDQGNTISTSRQSRSVTRKKSRTGGLRGKSEGKDPDSADDPSWRHSRAYSEKNGAVSVDGKPRMRAKSPEQAGRSSHRHEYEGSRTLSLGRHVDVNRLLDQLLLPDESVGGPANGSGEAKSLGSARHPHAVASGAIRDGKKSYKFTNPNEDKKYQLGKRKPPAPKTESNMGGGIGPPPY